MAKVKKLISYTDDEKVLLEEKAKLLGLDVTKLLLWSAIYPERIERIEKIRSC